MIKDEKENEEPDSLAEIGPWMTDEERAEAESENAKLVKKWAQLPKEQ